MNCLDIIKKYLEDNGFDGLTTEVCGCGLDDFAPCGDGPLPICRPAKYCEKTDMYYEE